MAKLDIDAEAHDWLARLESDPQAPAEVLKIAARYLRNRERLPGNLADHLADAFEAAALKQRTHQGPALLRELGFTQGNRRPAADWRDVGAYMSQRIDDGESQNQAAENTAAHFRISESTAKRLFREYREAMDIHDAISRDEASEGP